MGRSRGGGSSSSRAFLTSMIIVGLLWIMFGSVVVTARKLSRSTMFLVSTTSSGDSSNSKHWKFIEVGSEGKPDVEEEDLHLNYVSKRRVPTGPDPIHNRKTVLRFSRQPPPAPGPI